MITPRHRSMPAPARQRQRFVRSRRRGVEIGDAPASATCVIQGPRVSVATTTSSSLLRSARTRRTRNSMAAQRTHHRRPQHDPLHHTLNRGTAMAAAPRIGGPMDYGLAHIAHDCIVGNHTIFQQRDAAGHVEIGDYAILSGFSGVYQSCCVGEHAFIGMAARSTAMCHIRDRCQRIRRSARHQRWARAAASRPAHRRSAPTRLCTGPAQPLDAQRAPNSRGRRMNRRAKPDFIRNAACRLMNDTGTRVRYSSSSPAKLPATC